MPRYKETERQHQLDRINAALVQNVKRQVIVLAKAQGLSGKEANERFQDAKKDVWAGLKPFYSSKTSIQDLRNIVNLIDSASI